MYMIIVAFEMLWYIEVFLYKYMNQECDSKLQMNKKIKYVFGELGKPGEFLWTLSSSYQSKVLSNQDQDFWTYIRVAKVKSAGADSENLEPGRKQ